MAELATHIEVTALHSIIGRLAIDIQLLHRFDEVAKVEEDYSSFMYRADALEETTRMLLDKSSLHFNDVLYGIHKHLELGVRHSEVNYYVGFELVT